MSMPLQSGAEGGSRTHMGEARLHNVKKSKDKINNYDQPNQIYYITHNHYRLRNLNILQYTLEILYIKISYI